MPQRCGQVLCWSAIHKHGQLAVREYLDRLATQDHGRYTAAPVGCHDDQVTSSSLRGIYNALVRMLMLDAYGVALDASRLCGLGDDVQIPFHSCSNVPGVYVRAVG